MKWSPARRAATPQDQDRDKITGLLPAGDPGARIRQLAVDNALSRPTGYAYAPDLHSVLLAAKMAG